ncbi:hypothetical protein Hdeb2414_s0009g00308701 [Helianthus debilis subsp. tardiflorus]
MADSQWPNQTHAPNPSSTMPHGRGFDFAFHMSTHAPKPTPTIPHSLRRREKDNYVGNDFEIALILLSLALARSFDNQLWFVTLYS